MFEMNLRNWLQASFCEVKKKFNLMKIFLENEKIDRVILCDSKNHAEDLSAKMLDEDLENKGILKSSNPEYYKGTKFLFGVVENFLTGQFGIHIPSRDFFNLDSKYKNNLLIKSPFWVDESLINGENHCRIGSFGPFGFGFGIVQPENNRKILDGCFDQDIIRKARKAGRIYTASVQNKAKNIIQEITSNPSNAKAILGSINPYAFEELVAEILADNGFDVILTPKSGDGGKDIIAVTINEEKPVIMLVECKRRPVEKTLGPVEFSALVGHFYTDIKHNDMVSFASLITTAGKIGSAALSMEEDHHQLSIKDFDNLTKWLSEYGKVKNNLWIPNPLAEFI
jgi:hypothetical protein